MKNSTTERNPEYVIHTACGLDLSPALAEDHHYAYCLPCIAADKASAQRQASYASRRTSMTHLSAALRDKAIHYDFAAEQTACGSTNNLRLVTVEPQTLTCGNCRKALAANPAWRRNYRNW